ncbi:MAG: rod shape-determining protein MreC, partial [Alphaproteobacteria bacterium]
GIDKHAILAGRNTQAPVLEHLPDDIAVPAGARIVTSGKGGMFPAGLPVGLVRDNPDAGNLNTDVKLLVDMNNLDFVRIVFHKEGLLKAAQ